MSEYSSRLSRGAFVSAVFAQQGTGILCAAAVSIIVTSCFRAYFPAGPFPDRNLVLAQMPLGGFNQETFVRPTRLATCSLLGTIAKHMQCVKMAGRQSDPSGPCR